MNKKRGNLQAHTSLCASVCLCVWCHVPSGVEPGLWEPIELLLLLLLLSLLTDRLERSFLCTRCETGDGCFLGSEVWPAEGGCVTPRGVPWPLLSTVCRPFCCLAASPSMACCRDVAGWGRGWGWATERERERQKFFCNHLFEPERLHSCSLDWWQGDRMLLLTRKKLTNLYSIYFNIKCKTGKENTLWRDVNDNFTLVNFKKKNKPGNMYLANIHQILNVKITQKYTNDSYFCIMPCKD